MDIFTELSKNDNCFLNERYGFIVKDVLSLIKNYVSTFPKSHTYCYSVTMSNAHVTELCTEFSERISEWDWHMGQHAILNDNLKIYLLRRSSKGQIIKIHTNSIFKDRILEFCSKRGLHLRLGRIITIIETGKTICLQEFSKKLTEYDPTIILHDYNRIVIEKDRKTVDQWIRREPNFTIKIMETGKIEIIRTNSESELNTEMYSYIENDILKKLTQ